VEILGQYHCNTKSPVNQGLPSGFISTRSASTYLNLFYLLLVFEDHYYQPLSDLHSENLLQRLLNLDSIGPLVHLTVVVGDDTKCKSVLARRGPGAQALLNIIQAVCPQVISSLYSVIILFIMTVLGFCSRFDTQISSCEGID